MNIIIDESVSYGLAAVLRAAGHETIAIAEADTSGMPDERIYDLVIQNHAILITRDIHFTNAVQFPPEKTNGIVYIRRGNLTTVEEIEIAQKFLRSHNHDEYKGRLVTLYKESVKIR
jgi:predicted nuclease of predicted toxin-antitoxin system